jgi:NAD(P)H dehydrogenase (quinone)
MDSKPRILVMGATGRVGGAVVAQLLASSTVEIIAAARDVTKAQKLGVPVVHLDLDVVDTFPLAMWKIDRVFMATGYSVDMLRQSKDLINYARRAGVKVIVHLGAGGGNDTRVAHHAWHQFIERYIEWSKMTFIHLRPERFMQGILGFAGERYVNSGILHHYVGPARLSWVDCVDVAAVAVECLLRPADHAGNTYRLGYDAKTGDEIADLMTQALGQPFRYQARPPIEFLTHALAARAEPAYMKCVFDSYSDLTNGLDEQADETFDNFPTLVGRSPRMLADFIREHADEFRY